MKIKHRVCMKELDDMKIKHRVCMVVCVAILLVIGLYVGVHWYSTADGNNLDALARHAAAYFDDTALKVLDVTQRGDYLAMLYSCESGNLNMCVMDRDSLFPNRWKASGGKRSVQPGEIVSWNYGSPEREAVLIFCGADIPEQAQWYTFQNSGIVYTCPIENGQVLDVFIIQDSTHIEGSPVLLDSSKQEIKSHP